MAETLTQQYELDGHSGSVTALATSPEKPNMLLSASRDKTIIVWQINGEGDNWAVAKKALTGHNHFVQDVTISSDGEFALSGSWDKTMRLWDLNTGKTTQRFVGHTNDVVSVSFAPGDRQIISGSRDKTIKLWNVVGECKATIDSEGHSEWVSQVRFSPNAANPLIVSAGWDKLVKVWDLLQFKVKHVHVGHTGYINTTTISPDGSLCASGGKDGITMLWDLNDGKHLYSLDAHDETHALCFSPNRYWLCAATSRCIKIWDLESKTVVQEIVAEIKASAHVAKNVHCTSLTWSADGQWLFGGYTDNKIRAFRVTRM